MKEESEFLYHLPCEACGSSDANSMYSDGHTHCFSCGTTVMPQDGEHQPPPRKRRMADLILDGEIVELEKRKIHQSTCEKFGYRSHRINGKPVQIAPYFDESGQLVAQKIRDKDKNFWWTGNPDAALPFGSRAWPVGGKMLVLTEGEIDAMAVAQVWDLQFPVWSISCGADNPQSSGKKIRQYIARHKHLFDAFQKVVICFDQDEPGRFSAEIAATVLGPKAHIAQLPLKDAGEMLVAGRSKELVNALYKAQPYRPQGIVDLAAIKDRIKARPKEGLSWCFDTLTQLTYGKRLGELVAVGAGTGVGKSDFITQDALHMVQVHGQKLGIFALEQEPNETGIRLVGKAAQRPLHIPDYWDEAVFDAAWDQLVEEGKVFLYNHFGAMDWETIQASIEYLHHAEGVQYFYLDHLTALAAAEEDERTGLERIMAQMGALVKKIPTHITFVSHLTTPEGKPHEEGGRVMIRHFKGSRAIGFWSHFMFGMERNQQAESEEERTTTTFRILKDRYTGRSTGKVFYLGYDQERGLLYEKEDFGFDDLPEGEQKGADF